MDDKPTIAAGERITPVDTREELIYLLSRASELEHGVACVYLFAAYSLKNDVSEGGMTAAQAEMVRGWKRHLAHVAVEEMLHLAQVTNILTAIGGAPHFRRTNFPLPATAFPFGIKLSLEPFSQETIERFVCYEMPEAGILTPEQDAFFALIRERTIERGNVPALERDDGMAEVMAGYEPFDIDFSTVGEFYHKVTSAFDVIAEDELFIGPPEAQAKGRYLDFSGELVAVTDAASAKAGIEMIVEQGEAPTSAHPDAHFWVFDRVRQQYEDAVAAARATGIPFEPVRPVVSNPMTRYYDDAVGGTVITDPLTHFVADLFNVAYDTMLLMLLRFFAHADESEAELEKLSRATLRMMTTVLRPLGEALAKMPVGKAMPGRTAGPGFGHNRDIHLLPHKRSAWVFFGERLRQLAVATTRLRVQKAGAVPAEIEEAAAALEALAEEFAPADRKWDAAAEEAEFRAIEAGLAARIVPELNGPLLVTNVATFRNCRDEPIATKPEMALCRCGMSQNKPFCDGSHAACGFTGARSAEHTEDRVIDYAGARITIHYNRLQCAASERCWLNLPAVFRHGETPWIHPDGAAVEETIAVIARCPSGALRYTVDGRTGPSASHEPAIRIIQNGPYEVTGIPLESESWCAGADRTRYALCRCGHSKNKPFCDGSHWAANFKDERN